MKHILANAAEAGHVELPFPSIVFGLIAMATFIVLGVITWSYRDVANRHDHKSSGSKANH